MASKKFDKNSDEFKFFGEFWKWTQEHYIPEDSDEYWEELLASAAVICNKYKDHKLFPKLMITVLDYLGEENKRING
jgi:hypothetical protein